MRMWKYMLMTIKKFRWAEYRGANMAPKPLIQTKISNFWFNKKSRFHKWLDCIEITYLLLKYGIINVISTYPKVLLIWIYFYTFDLLNLAADVEIWKRRGNIFWTCLYVLSTTLICGWWGIPSGLYCLSTVISFPSNKLICLFWLYIFQLRF